MSDDDENEAQRQHELGGLWAQLSKDEQDFHDDLIANAKELLEQAENFKERGEFARADEARLRAEQFLRQADDLLQRARDAFNFSRRSQQRESELFREGDTQLRTLLQTNFASIRDACRRLADSVQTSNGINDETRGRILNSYGEVSGELERTSSDHVDNVALGKLLHFLHDVHVLTASDVKATWKRFEAILKPFLP